MNQIFYDLSEVEIFDFVTEEERTYAILHTYKLRLLQRKYKRYIWQKKFSIQARIFRENNGRWPNIFECEKIFEQSTKTNINKTNTQLYSGHFPPASHVFSPRSRANFRNSFCLNRSFLVGFSGSRSKSTSFSFAWIGLHGIMG